MKKIFACFLAIAICFSVASVALAANWMEILRNDNVLISIDLDSIKHKNGKIRAWEKWIFRSEKVIKEWQKILKVRPEYSLNYNEYDVNNETKRLLSSTYYAKNGSAIDSIGEDYRANRIVPDSILEYVFKILKAIVESQE